MAYFLTFAPNFENNQVINTSWIVYLASSILSIIIFSTEHNPYSGMYILILMQKHLSYFYFLIYTKNQISLETRTPLLKNSFGRDKIINITKIKSCVLRCNGKWERTGKDLIKKFKKIPWQWCYDTRYGETEL